MSLDTPVLLIVYNRPATTAQVFERIALVRPRRLYVAGDGPKSPEDVEMCAAVRAMTARIDWDCELRTSFGSVNLGCARSVPSAITWVLSQEDEAIILEDDCVPSDDFFDYCQELLRRYRSDSEVMHISGTNLLGEVHPGGDYVFSRFCLPPWGWATWRRAWRHYRFNARGRMLGTPAGDITALSRYATVWQELFDRNDIRHFTWDLQWNLSLWANRGIAVIPSTNLVSNVGFGEEATLTRMSASRFANLPAGRLHLPVRPPPDRSVPFDVPLEDALMTLIGEVRSVNGGRELDLDAGDETLEAATGFLGSRNWSSR